MPTFLDAVFHRVLVLCSCSRPRHQALERHGGGCCVSRAARLAERTATHCCNLFTPCYLPRQDAAAKLKAAESSQAALKADLAKARAELDRVS